MDAAKIQARIDRGAGIAARYLGTDHVIHRPSGAGDPIAPGNVVGTIKADFKADFGFSGARPNLWGKAVWGGLFDRTTTLPGDYLVGDQGTFFIAAQQLHAPTACVQCNRVVSVARPGLGTPGPGFYSGAVQGTETAILTAWPASVLQGGRGERGEVDLPADARMPWWAVLLPVLPARLRTDDLITDEDGRSMIVSSAEETDLGWRLTARQVGA